MLFECDDPSSLPRRDCRNSKSTVECQMPRQANNAGSTQLPFANQFRECTTDRRKPIVVGRFSETQGRGCKMLQGDFFRAPGKGSASNVVCAAMDGQHGGMTHGKLFC